MTFGQRMLCFGIVVSVAVLLTSCVSAPVGKLPPSWKDRRPRIKHYEPVTGYELELTLITPRRTFFAGEDVILDFKLTNTGTETVRIDEWMQDQDSNLKIYYHAGREGDDSPPEFTPESWSVDEPDVPENPLRCPLELNPRNSVLISCPVPFVAGLSPAALPQVFYLQPRLNLKSLPLSGEMIVITVR